MLRLVLVLLFLQVPLFAFADVTEDQLRSFLQSREVIERVFFETRSKELTQTARETLDALIPNLKKISDQHYLIRVEGFSSPEGNTSKNVNLSLQRAFSVRTYLKEQHKLDLEVFLTGFGDGGSLTDLDKTRRVDIAVYLQPEAAMALFDDQGTVEKIVIE